MSSLLQFNGETGRAGVRLQFCRTHDGSITGDYTDEYHCDDCGRSHPRIALAWRKPRGMFGCWVVFQYNGSEHAPDLSVPIKVQDYPRGSVLLSDAESSGIWHS